MSEHEFISNPALATVQKLLHTSTQPNEKTQIYERYDLLPFRECVIIFIKCEELQIRPTLALI